MADFDSSNSTPASPSGIEVKLTGQFWDQLRRIVREEIEAASRPSRTLPPNDPEPRPIRVLPDGRISRQDAAKFLGRSDKTLADWKRLGRGPMPKTVGGRVFYLMKDLEAFRDTGAREAAQ